MARTLQGKVVSDKQDKTIVVRVDRRKTHPIYRKQYTVSSKFYAHDEKNESKAGDVVEIVESKPISKTKRWTFSRLINRPEDAEMSGAEK